MVNRQKGTGIQGAAGSFAVSCALEKYFTELFQAGDIKKFTGTQIQGLPGFREILRNKIFQKNIHKSILALLKTK